MRRLKEISVAIGSSAVIAAVFSYGMSRPTDFWPWFAFAIACSVVNGLIMTPTADYAPGRSETTAKTLSGHTVHAPRFSRLKDPVLVSLVIVLCSVLVWIFVR